MPDTGRRVEFEGALNFRDLGGLPVSGGGVVRRGVVYRSDSLHALTPADLDRLHDGVGVRTVVDLRMDREVDEIGPRAGHFRDDVRMLRLPLFTDYPPEWAEPMNWATEEQRAQRYLDFLEAGPGAVVTLVRELGDPAAVPAVVHCHSGRDRTGIVVGVVLDLLGVDRALIGDDYAVTARYITEWELSPERMTLLLGLLDERYGSPEGLLREHGLVDDDLAALRSALLDP
ncbi:MAG TPA: tyrosine-protein phosphatase [Mycobacteriales bacterium]|nr:tyrosine-protein phosphatase [Mycobacteriales bacterium]